MVGLRLRRLAPLPAAVGLHPAEEQDQQHDRTREEEGRRDQQPVADDPHPRRQRSHRPTAVQRQHGQQVEEVQQEADEGQRLPEHVAGRLPDPEREQGPDRAQHRSGQADARLGGGVVRQLLHADHGAHEGDEQRRSGLDALAAQLQHVAHLMDEDQDHEARCERPAPDQRVGRHRDQHRPRGRQDLELREQQEDALELREQDAQRGEPAAHAVADRLALRLQRLSHLRLRRRRVRRWRVVLHVFHCRSARSGHLKAGKRTPVAPVDLGRRTRAALSLEVHTRGRQASTWTSRVGSCESRCRRPRKKAATNASANSHEFKLAA